MTVQDGRMPDENPIARAVREADEAGAAAFNAVPRARVRKPNILMRTRAYFIHSAWCAQRGYPVPQPDREVLLVCVVLTIVPLAVVGVGLGLLLGGVW